MIIRRLFISSNILFKYIFPNAPIIRYSFIQIIPDVPYHPIQIDHNKIQTKDSMKRLAQTISKDSHSIIDKYPYSYIPISIIKQHQDLAMYNEAINDIVAFRCLANIQESQKIKAYFILFPNQTEYEFKSFNQGLTGRLIYSKYFKSKFPKLLDILSSTHQSLIERKVALKIIKNLTIDRQSQQMVENIKIEQILYSDETGELALTLLQILIKHNLDYSIVLTFLINKLKINDIKMQENSIQRVIIMNIVLIPNFLSYFQAQISKYIMKKLINLIPTFNNYELLTMIRALYRLKTYQCKKFAKKTFCHLASIDPRQNNLGNQYYMTLCLKCLKFTKFQKNEFIQDLMSIINKGDQYIEKIQYINFPLLKTQLLIQYYTQNYQSKQFQQIKAITMAHMRSILKQLSDNYQHVKYSEIQISSFLSLLRMAFPLFDSFEQRRDIIELLSSKMMVQFKQQQTINYKCLLILLSNSLQFNFKQTNIKIQVNQCIQDYFKSFCIQISKEKALERMDEIIFLLNIIDKFKWDHLILWQGLSFITKNELKAHNLSLKSLSMLIQMLSHLPLQIIIKNKQIIYMYLQDINHHLTKRKLRFTTIIHLIDVFDKLQFKDIISFNHITQLIFLMIKKQVTFKPNSEQLVIIKKSIIDRGLGKTSLQCYVQEMINNSENSFKIREKYLYEEKRLKKLKNRSKEKSD